MKKYSYIVTILLAVLVSGCEKYTDVVPTGSIVVETAEDYYKLVSLPNRAYPINNFQYLVDDQWIRESYVIGQRKSIDIINFTFDDSDARTNLLSGSSFYNQTYSYINRWNTVISLVDGSKGEDNIKQLAKAEAKIYRAFDHFMLVNVYAKAYDPATAATDGGICIMDKYDLEAKPIKSTVAQVYDFIQKDIEDALPYLQKVTVDPYHPSLAFAYGLKAKIHLFKHEFSLAKEAAQKSLSYNNTIYDLVAYSKLGGPSTLPVLAGENQEVLSFMYMTGYTEMSFAYTCILSPELVKLFGANDARFNLFMNTTSTSLLDPGAGTAYFSVNYTKFFYPTVGMKTTEVYLMLAECYAREGSLSEAMGIINQLRAKRILSGITTLPVPGTIKGTMNIIIEERRKELLLGFHRFFDLKRLNNEPDYAKTVTHTFPIVNKTVPQVTYSLSPNSRLYIIPFPSGAMKLNPNLRLNTNETLPF
ncbi:RagB/SusD family nutrient uptake outer membrane protein [Pedobacter agri]|uniref:RagB/SusD family nutrient uptake outer membrane protein n=1 Tax=Pedobacter agri TaxID=454586 RepID=A0A9X3DCB4_9SPHI|nr:RagB/SusD family nutrient uptake outer membrane protein [Pedobacter agri]MCX3265022.1 RagB/SusD family nutrient uptake outer membrane protein [Pedobacter agri]